MKHISLIVLLCTGYFAHSAQQMQLMLTAVEVDLTLLSQFFAIEPPVSLSQTDAELINRLIDSSSIKFRQSQNSRYREALFKTLMLLGKVPGYPASQKGVQNLVQAIKDQGVEYAVDHIIFPAGYPGKTVPKDAAQQFFDKRGIVIAFPDEWAHATTSVGPALEKEKPTQEMPTGPIITGSDVQVINQLIDYCLQNYDPHAPLGSPKRGYRVNVYVILAMLGKVTGTFADHASPEYLKKAVDLVRARGLEYAADNLEHPYGDRGPFYSEVAQFWQNRGGFFVKPEERPK